MRDYTCKIGKAKLRLRFFSRNQIIEFYVYENKMSLFFKKVIIYRINHTIFVIFIQIEKEDIIYGMDQLQSELLQKWEN